MHTIANFKLQTYIKSTKGRSPSIHIGFLLNASSSETGEETDNPIKRIGRFYSLFPREGALPTAEYHPSYAGFFLVSDYELSAL